MTNFDGPSLRVPPSWAELYFDAQDADGARLREIVAGDPRLEAAGFRAFLEQERPRLHTLSIYEVGVLIVDRRGGPAGPAGARPWPVDPGTALRLVELLRGRADRAAPPDGADGAESGVELRTLPQASIPSGNGAPPPPPPVQGPPDEIRPDRTEYDLPPGPPPEHPESDRSASAPPSAPTVPPDRSPSLAESIPSRIGDYQIVRQMGGAAWGWSTSASTSTSIAWWPSRCSPA